jgi:hypothetical protein
VARSGWLAPVFWDDASAATMADVFCVAVVAAGRDERRGAAMVGAAFAFALPWGGFGREARADE